MGRVLAECRGLLERAESTRWRWRKWPAVACASTPTASSASPPPRPISPRWSRRALWVGALALTAIALWLLTTMG